MPTSAVSDSCSVYHPNELSPTQRPAHIACTRVVLPAARRCHWRWSPATQAFAAVIVTKRHVRWSDCVREASLTRSLTALWTAGSSVARQGTLETCRHGLRPALCMRSSGHRQRRSSTRFMAAGRLLKCWSGRQSSVVTSRESDTPIQIQNGATGRDPQQRMEVRSARVLVQWSDCH